jgi:hypothetical protein
MAQDRARWWTLVNAVNAVLVNTEPSGSMKCGEFLG